MFGCFFFNKKKKIRKCKHNHEPENKMKNGDCSNINKKRISSGCNSAINISENINLKNSQQQEEKGNPFQISSETRNINQNTNLVPKEYHKQFEKQIAPKEISHDCTQRKFTNISCTQINYLNIRPNINAHFSTANINHKANNNFNDKNSNQYIHNFPNRTSDHLPNLPNRFSGKIQMSNLDNSLRTQIDARNKIQEMVEKEINLKVVYEPPFFSSAMMSKELILNPFLLGFEPKAFWAEINEYVTFGHLVNNYFRLKNIRIAKFIYKLYNMLRITSEIPFFKGIVGVNWITDKIISINVECISSMLNIASSSTNSLLFGENGFFTSHGFIEIKRDNYQEAGLCGFPEIKEPNIKLIFHQNKTFVKKYFSRYELDEFDYQSTIKKPKIVDKLSMFRYPCWS